MFVQTSTMLECVVKDKMFWLLCFFCFHVLSFFFSSAFVCIGIYMSDVCWLFFIVLLFFFIAIFGWAPDPIRAPVSRGSLSIMCDVSTHSLQNECSIWLLTAWLLLLSMVESLHDQWSQDCAVICAAMCLGSLCGSVEQYSRQCVDWWFDGIAALCLHAVPHHTTPACSIFG